MVFDWNEEKNEQLKKERNIGFERIIIAIEAGDILDILDHPNKERYGKQLLIIVKIDDYAYVVPTLCKDEEYFLKTIFPSRKYTINIFLKKGGSKMIEEKELINSIENDEWKSVRNKNDLMDKLKNAAKSTMLKDQRMNIRIAKKDLEGLKTKALEEGIPYQTLVSSILHKYVSGKLVDQNQ